MDKPPLTLRSIGLICACIFYCGLALVGISYYFMSTPFRTAVTDEYSPVYLYAVIAPQVITLLLVNTRPLMELHMRVYMFSAAIYCGKALVYIMGNIGVVPVKGPVLQYFLLFCGFAGASYIVLMGLYSILNIVVGRIMRNRKKSLAKDN